MGVAAVTAVGLLSLALPASALGARGCDRPAGDPSQGAVLQYCPKKTPKKQATSESGEQAGPVGGSGGGPTAAATAGKAAPEPSTIPFLDYPGGGGVSTIVWILLALLALLVGRAIYRRYRSSRSGGTGGGFSSRLPIRGESGR